MRAKSVVYTRQRKKKIFRLAKGSYATKKNRWRMVIQQVERSLNYAYTGRKDNKANFRTLWIVRLNAAVREEGISYNRFIFGLKKANVAIDRKMLAEIAVNDNTAFKQLVEVVKAA
ncbi:50S ribosomal protein L20 [Endomicrobiia bacterium]|uniref:50S ribosomal protein L20 n=1 Tax=Endomicrobium trichonymphae TaxID=1408204 RepID=UPI0008662D6F|nr:50S ribosomal protein L20 [Candidatus Endomicrobium trichonymphae]GHT07351.1 50S ribosomal protein L20 [Endomicrobiia bacterium]BAV58847.1 50S ribosomal protein L20 [Candidatus Endomicrobium trichonymphae]GHT08750.1 50S ribosomal protein L20 [Endomicrobiia bacterium]GHT12363.1 50S ribosomal protein L20 [Endomicrobiia bacterium]GHT15531.1 50S ribosomal protein L20 [Endomicrobiia bacterium]